MGGGADILILAAIAAFLIFRLYRVLGKRTGHERPPDPFAGVANDDGRRDPVVPLPDRRPERSEEPSRPMPAEPDTPLAAGMARIRGADPSFDPQEFLAGVRKAFEIIVAAFAAGETATLRALLDDEVYANFANTIEARQRDGHVLQTTLVGITSAEMIEADLDGRNAAVTIKIVSEQINVTRDGGGAVVDGDPTTVAAVTDLWTFSRNTRSRDPNWKLVATSSPN